MSTHGSEGARPRHEASGYERRKGAGLGLLDLAFACGALALSGAAYFVGIAPARAAAMDDGHARAELVKLDAEKRKLAEDYRSRRAARDAAATALQGSVRLVPETEINARRAAIAALAEQSTIQIQATRPLPTLRGKRFDLVPIELDGLGNATDFARFAEALRARMPDTAIRRFELSGATEQSAPRFTAQLVWYTLPESVVKSNARAAGGARASDEAQRDQGADAVGAAAADRDATKLRPEP